MPVTLSFSVATEPDFLKIKIKNKNLQVYQLADDAPWDKLERLCLPLA